MRIAALYDIHGNVPALEAVLAEVEAAAPDLVVIGGDVAGGPQPAETLAAVDAIALPKLFVRGNGDRAPDPFDRERLSADQVATLAAWPLTVTVEADGLGEVLFCHASPRSDDELLTRISPPELLAPMFVGVTQSVVVCGHVHVQFDRTVGDRRIINAGSVGMAYEGSEPVAAWALFGPGVELRQTPYDRARFDGVLEASGYPNPDWFDTAPADEVTAHFEALAQSQAS